MRTSNSVVWYCRGFTVILENFELRTEEKLSLQVLLYEQKMAAQAAQEAMRQALLEEKSDEDNASALKSSSGGNVVVDANGKEISQRKAAYTMRTEGNMENTIEREMNAKPKDLRTEEEELPPNVLADSDDVSCLVLKLDSPIRRLCGVITENWMVNLFIFLCILYSTFLLALDSPWQLRPFARSLIDTSDPILLAIFTVEMTIKIVAYGFYGSLPLQLVFPLPSCQCSHTLAVTVTLCDQ